MWGVDMLAGGGPPYLPTDVGPWEAPEVQLNYLVLRLYLSVFGEAFG